jgi:streptogramin lyase
VGIATGPDGNLWFTELSGGKIGRVTPAGTVTEPVVLAAGSQPFGIVGGPDGNLWFTEAVGNQIGRLTFGSLTEFPVPTGSSYPNGITAGPDGNLWFTEQLGNKIGRITTSGAITGEFTVPTLNSQPYGITVGPDGNLWFAEWGANQIGRITPSGAIKEFSTGSGSGPIEITSGPDGALWFTESFGDEIGRITTSGTVTQFPLPTAGSFPEGITRGADGNLWFAEFNNDKIGRITPTGVITEFPVPTPASDPNAITAGPDGNIWFTEYAGNKIGRLALDKGLTVTRTSITPTERSSFTGVVATFTDADPSATPGSFTASITWGDGSTSAGTVSADARGGFDVTGTHTHAEEGKYAVAVTVTDVDTSHDIGGSTATVVRTATVADAPLSAVGVNVTSGRFTGPVLVAVFSDAAGAEPVSHYTASINWGDGSAPSAGTIAASGSLFTVSGSHVYPLNGTYTVRVSIRDDGGATASVTDTAVVSSVYPLTPAQVRHAYGLDTLPLNSNDGTGQTIAIVDAYDDPNVFRDLDTFDRSYGVSPGQTLYQQYGPSALVLTKVTPEGTPAGNAGWAQEISLDVQWAHAIAPGAHILLVEARTNSLSDLLAAADYAVGLGSTVVSMSWGSSEFAGEVYYDWHFAHSGVTFVAAAGDTGSQTLWPAVSPNVLAVGGTSLSVDLGGNYLGETGWSSGGGGVSAYEPRPAYQVNVPQGGGSRTSPDVAYNADPATGVAVYDSYVGGGGWGQYGGTSAGAPQWAALVAIADQGRVQPLSSSSTLQALYALLSSSNTINTTYLHDVTSGSSGTYSAAPGYDLVTGLGTPKADTLIPYLRAAPQAVHGPLLLSGHVQAPLTIPAQPLSASGVPLTAHGSLASREEIRREALAAGVRNPADLAWLPGLFDGTLSGAPAWSALSVSSVPQHLQAGTAPVPATEPVFAPALSTPSWPSDSAVRHQSVAGSAEGTSLRQTGKEIEELGGWGTGLDLRADDRPPF